MNRLHHTVHGFILQTAVFFEKIIPADKLFHRHERLNLSLSERRTERKNTSDVIQCGQPFVLRKRVGEPGRNMVIIQSEHLPGSFPAIK